MSKHSLKGKAVLVGGGAKNLGGLISRTFAAEGAKICVHYNSASTKADADKTLADIKAAGGRGVHRSRRFHKSRRCRRGVCGDEEAIRWDRHRYQYGGQGAQEALRGDDGSGIRFDGCDQFQGRLLLHPGSRQTTQRRREDLHHCHVAARCLHRLVFDV